MLKIRASTHLLTEPDVCAKSSNPQLIAKLFSPASGIDTACDRSIVFFAQRFLFQIIISTQRLMKLYFIYILFAICSLNASSKSHYFFSNGVGNSVLSHINCGNFLSFVPRNTDWWRLPSRIYPNLKVTRYLCFEREKKPICNAFFWGCFYCLYL